MSYKCWYATKPNLGWTGAHYVFAVETFLKTGESVIATQRAFYFISEWCRSE